MRKIKDSLNTCLFIITLSYKCSPRYFVGKFISNITSIVINIFNLFLIGEVINNLLIDNGKILYRYIIMYIFVIILEVMNKYVNKYIELKYEDYFKRYIDNVLINKIPVISFRFFDYSTVLTDIEDSWSLINGIKTLLFNLFELISNVIKATTILILLIRISPMFVIFSIIIMVPLFFIHRRINNLQWMYDRENTKYNRELYYYKNILTSDNAQEIKVYDLYGFFVKKYNYVWREWYNLKTKINLHKGILKFLYNFGLLIVEVGLIVIVIYKLMVHSILLGNAIYYISLGTYLSGSLENSINLYMELEFNIKEVHKLRKIINLEETSLNSGDIALSDSFSVEFKNVSFTYPNASKKAIDNCSFFVKNGEKVGLVGLNGSGKSTIIKLLLRLYDPSEGEILINGIDIKKYKLEDLRRNMGVFFQDYVRYSLSFRENIGLSNIELMNDNQAIKEICKVIGFDFILRKWNYSFDFPLTRRFFVEGQELSGGEWQKVCLMRAMFGRKKIYILDEPSSALDPQAEYELFSIYNQYIEASTSFLITHRLSNVIESDKILLLEKGKVIEQGTHDELMKKNGRYSFIYNMQIKGYQ